MTIKGYTQGYIVQYVVADLDGTVIYTFDDRETAEICAEEGQQIVELDGYGYVAEITDSTETDVFTTDDQCGGAQSGTASNMTNPRAPQHFYQTPAFDGWNWR